MDIYTLLRYFTKVMATIIRCSLRLRKYTEDAAQNIVGCNFSCNVCDIV